MRKMADHINIINACAVAASSLSVVMPINTALLPVSGKTRGAPVAFSGSYDGTVKR